MFSPLRVFFNYLFFHLCSSPRLLSGPATAFPQKLWHLFRLFFFLRANFISRAAQMPIWIHKQTVQIQTILCTWCFVDEFEVKIGLRLATHLVGVVWEPCRKKRRKTELVKLVSPERGLWRLPGGWWAGGGQTVTTTHTLGRRPTHPSNTASPGGWVSPPTRATISRTHSAERNAFIYTSINVGQSVKTFITLVKVVQQGPQPSLQPPGVGRFDEAPTARSTPSFCPHSTRLRDLVLIFMSQTYRSLPLPRRIIFGRFSHICSLGYLVTNLVMNLVIP